MDTLLTEAEKQANENFLVEFHDIFARHRKDNGMTTVHKVKLTAKYDKSNYGQNLPLPIHLKADLILELTLMHEHGIITVLFFRHPGPVFLRKGNPTEKTSTCGLKDNQQFDRK